ncbi:MAG: asparagine synthase (glutamine-hydrolyzing) [Actinobacteria bacterium]|nr:asparagine synthase (glutamine-hydrolyzing) [Actinomycetota bacterium]
MCGIAGLVSRHAPPDPALVERMIDALRHRGPDEGGVATLGSCVLGHRRLQVIDLDTGSQPVSNEQGDVTCVFNGELYEFRALREELAARGHRIPGSGDTPVLPHTYEEHGAGFARRLHGMFALALWDGRRQRLVLARDRVGKKPLLWTRLADGTLAFASELKALTLLDGVSRELDLAALDAFLALQYVPGPGTALRGVHKLRPGHFLVADAAGERIERYWEPRPADVQLSEDEWLPRVRDTVREAVRKRLVADVPLGALLSGGIDSSIVVSQMAQLQRDPVRTFSVGFSDTRYDERENARLVAQRYGTVHEEVLLEPDAAELLPRLAAAFDEPFGDSSALPTYLVSEVARRAVTVALVGDGGDEAFAGYERYRAHALAGRVGRLLPAALLRGGARSLRALPSGRSELRAPTVRAARFLEAAATGHADRYGRLMEIFPPSLRGLLWSEEALAQIGRQPSAGELLGPPPAPGLTGLQQLDVATYLPGDLLYKADIASMACSLELRAPFLDHEVLELGLALPDSLKVRGGRGKVALRRAFARDLPPEILRAGKRGFGVPVARWFRAELRELAGDLLLGDRATARGLFRRDAVETLLEAHASGRADHGARLWSLVMLELWQQEYVDVRAVPAAALAAAP